MGLGAKYCIILILWGFFSLSIKRKDDKDMLCVIPAFDFKQTIYM